MPCHVRAIAVDCRDPERLCAFWAAALDQGVVRRWADEHGVGYVQLEDLPPGAPLLLFQPVPEERAGKNRLHLDLACDPGCDRPAELRRLGALGAVVLSDDAERWTVLADPEGNEFCLLGKGA
jgi:catechol 2,3-dioxygenase-like lactoylglutathione lyase family enzyme